MTTQDLIDLAADHWFVLSIWFVAIPLLTWVIGFFHRNRSKDLGNWCYVYSAFGYFTCLPGIMAAVLTAYSIFLLKQNLLQANLTVYVLPIVSMGVTLGLIRSRVEFTHIPGFDRLIGLMTLVAVTFLLVLAIEKTRIWLFFSGSITRLIGLVVGIFALLKWSAYALFRRSDQPKVDAPEFPHTNF